MTDPSTCARCGKDAPYVVCVGTDPVCHTCLADGAIPAAELARYVEILVRTAGGAQNG